MGFGIDPNQKKKAKAGPFGVDATAAGASKGGGFASKYAAEEKDMSSAQPGPGVGEANVGKQEMAAPEAGPKLKYIPGGKETPTPGSEKHPAEDSGGGMGGPSALDDSENMARFVKGNIPEDSETTTFGPDGEVHKWKGGKEISATGEVGGTDSQWAPKWGKAKGEREILGALQGEGVDDQLAALEAQKQAGLGNLEAEEAQGVQDLAQSMNESGIGVSGAFGAGKEGYTTAANLAQQSYAADMDVQKAQMEIDWKVKKLETQLSVWGTTMTEENKKAIQDEINKLKKEGTDLEKQATYESASDVMQTTLANAIADYDKSDGPDLPAGVKNDAYKAQGELLQAVQDGKLTYQEAEALFAEYVSLMQTSEYMGGKVDAEGFYASVEAWKKKIDEKYGTQLGEVPPTDEEVASGAARNKALFEGFGV